MALTRANVETILIDRLSVLLTFVGRDGTTKNGTNASLNDALGFALRMLNITPVDPTNVADADLMPLDPALAYALFDLAEYRAIKTCLNSYTATDENSQDRRQAWNAMSLRFQRQLDSLEVQYQGLINIRDAPVQTGNPRYKPPEQIVPITGPDLADKIFPDPMSVNWGVGGWRYDH